MNFQKFQLKLNILKHSTSHKQWCAWRKLLRPPPDESFLRLWNKNFRKEISGVYRDSPSAPKMQFLGVEKWCSVNVFFWYQRETYFWLLCGSLFFIMLSELRCVKWVRFLERNCIVKWVIFFASFLALGFSTRSSETSW